MSVGDVWILGAGASAEEGVPLFREFNKAAWRVLAELGNAKEKQTFEDVLGFWDQRFPALNIEQLFAFLDSPELSEVTQEGETGDLRRDTVFVIAKVVTHTAGRKVSYWHKLFADNYIRHFASVITLNWDILLDRAIVDNGNKVEYALPRSGEWNPQGSASQSLVVMKLHGSLNWAYCTKCDLVTYLDEKHPATEFLLTGGGIACRQCGSGEKIQIMVVPPVLSKLSVGDTPLKSVWKNAYNVLKDSRRVFMVGYSFPESDFQLRLFFNKALKENQKIEEINVVTRPKFGSVRLQFEDYYVKMLEGSGKTEKIRFEYFTFRKLAEVKPFPQ